MKIVVLIPDLNAAAEYSLNKLLKQKDIQIIGIIKSDITPMHKSYWKYMVYGIKKSGIFYGAMIAITAHLHLLGFGIASFFWWKRKKKWLSINELIKKHNLMVHNTENINSIESINAIKKMKPDILLSLYFDQILKKEALSIATSANLNMHPGILPKYKGLWSSFWKQYHGEKKGGVTLHYINEKIDEGDAIAQIEFPIKHSDTYYQLMLRSAKHGTKMLIKNLRKMKKGTHIPKIRLKGKPKYFSLPKRRHFKKYLSTNRKLFRFKDLIKQIERDF